MNRPGRTVQSTWVTMLILQTVGTVDAKHKLPAPKQYVAVSVLWGIFFLLADTGLGRTAARLSLLVLLTATVVGPFGKKLIDWLGTISGFFGTAPQPGSQASSGTTTTGPSGVLQA